MNGNSYQDFCPKAYEKALKEAREYYSFAIKEGYQLDEDATDDEILEYFKKAI